jgi:hypothetical protein
MKYQLNGTVKVFNYLVFLRYGFLLILLFTTCFCSAQSLPNTQKNSVYLTGLKVDGKALEIENRFQAYNKAIDAYYTLSNDENHLFLIVKIKYAEIVPKVLLGGITLTLNQSKAKRDTAGLSITFPFLEADDRGKVTNLYATAQNERLEKEEKESDVTKLNAALKSGLKTIKVTGLPGVKTPAISIYNEEGIRAAALFDKELLLTYELSVPLTLLSSVKKGANVFSYQIKVNSPYASTTPNVPNGPPPPPMMVSTTSVTDLRAEYKLAQK